MLIRTPGDMGALIRSRRKELGLDQAGLAERIGVNRKWVIEMEKGHARAELGIVLRTLNALNIRLSEFTDQPAPQKVRVQIVDIDKIISAETRKVHP